MSVSTLEHVCLHTRASFLGCNAILVVLLSDQMSKKMRYTTRNCSMPSLSPVSSFSLFLSFHARARAFSGQDDRGREWYRGWYETRKWYRVERKHESGGALTAKAISAASSTPTRPPPTMTTLFASRSSSCACLPCPCLTPTITTTRRNTDNTWHPHQLCVCACACVCVRVLCGCRGDLQVAARWARVNSCGAGLMTFSL